jgi:hypothetical protein
MAKLDILYILYNVRQIFLSEYLTAKQLISLSADPWAADKLVNLANIVAEQLISLSADPWAADKLVNLSDIVAEQRGK